MTGSDSILTITRLILIILLIYLTGLLTLLIRPTRLLLLLRCDLCQLQRGVGLAALRALGTGGPAAVARAIGALDDDGGGEVIIVVLDVGSRGVAHGCLRRGSLVVLIGWLSLVEMLLNLLHWITTSDLILAIHFIVTFLEARNYKNSYFEKWCPYYLRIFEIIINIFL